MVNDVSGCARLSSKGAYSIFSFGPHVIRFRTSRALKRYLSIKQWDNGYLVDDAEYDGASAPVEEYIDLVPILNNLYFDAKRILAPIKEVVVSYE